MEKEVAALLHGSDSVLEKTQVLTAAEQRALDAMSLEEVWSQLQLLKTKIWLTRFIDGVTPHQKYILSFSS